MAITEKKPSSQIRNSRRKDQESEIQRNTFARGRISASSEEVGLGSGEAPLAPAVGAPAGGGQK